MCPIAKYGRLLAVAAALSLGGSMPCAATTAAPAQTANWETVTTAVDTTGDERLEITSRDGYIYVGTTKELTVRVYTILGQLVSSHTLQPGVSRLRIKARGIYILKADNQTRRVTV